MRLGALALVFLFPASALAEDAPVTAPPGKVLSSGALARLPPSVIGKLSVLSRRVPRAWEGLGGHLESAEEASAERAAVVTEVFLEELSEEDLRSMPPSELHVLGERLLSLLAGERTDAAAPDVAVDPEERALGVVAEYWRGHRALRTPTSGSEGERDPRRDALEALRKNLELMDPAYRALVPEETLPSLPLKEHFLQRATAATAEPYGPWNGRLLSVMEKALQDPRIQGELLLDRESPAGLQSSVRGAAEREAEVRGNWLASSVEGTVLEAWARGRAKSLESTQIRVLANYYLKLKSRAKEAAVARLVDHWLEKDAARDGLPTAIELAISLDGFQHALLQKVRMSAFLRNALICFSVGLFLSGGFILRKMPLLLLSAVPYIVSGYFRGVNSRLYRELGAIYVLGRLLRGQPPLPIAPTFTPSDWK